MQISPLGSGGVSLSPFGPDAELISYYFSPGGQNFNFTSSFLTKKRVFGKFWPGEGDGEGGPEFAATFFGQFFGPPKMVFFITWVF